MRAPFLAIPAAFGHPRHGIARAGKLRRLDGVVETYTATPETSDTLIFKRPGLPAVPAALSAEAGSGQAFRTYAVLGGRRCILHGSNTITSGRMGWLYVDAAGDRWLVEITSHTPRSVLSVSSSFTLDVTFRLYGVFGAASVTVYRSHSIAASVFGVDMPTYAGWETGASQIMCHDITSVSPRLEDATRTGDKACIAWTWKDTATQAKPSGDATLYDRVVSALAEITLSTNVDGYPDFAMANALPMSDCIPEHTFSGPVDGGSGCPSGPGDRSWSSYGRVLGAYYSDDDIMRPVWMDVDWSLDVGTSGTVTATYTYCPPGSTPPGVPINLSASAASSASMALRTAFDTVSAHLANSISGTFSGTYEPGNMYGVSGATTSTYTLDGSAAGGATLGPITATGSLTLDTLISCGIIDGLEYFRDYEEYEFSAQLTSQVAEPSMPTACEDINCVGEWPYNLMAGPLVADASGTFPGYTIYWRRLSNKLFALLIQNATTGDHTLHKLIGPMGEITDVLQVVSCSYGVDVGCEPGGYMFQAASLPINLGAITVANLIGSYQPETDEAVIATDGTALCYV